MKKLPLMLALMMAGALPTLAQVNVVFTQHNDQARTGQILSETVLTPSNVNDTHFGLIHKIALDDQCYASPLVMNGVTIGGVVHNVVYMETVNNSVYALDATTGAQLWHVTLGTAAVHGDGTSGDCTDEPGKWGIISTPAISTGFSCIYVVAITKGSYGDAAGVLNFRLHKLDLATGNEDAGSPVLITGTSFVPGNQNQRPALLKASSNVYVCFGSHCDSTPSNGRIFAFDASTLAKVAELDLSVPGGSAYLDSIWQCGQGPAADSSQNIYFITGNGTWDGVNNFGMSFMKLSPTLGVSSYFTANDYANLNTNDTDLGMGGCMVMPGTGDIVGGGKSGKIYVLNPASLGGLSANDANAIQVFQATFPPPGQKGHIRGSPAYFANSTGPAIYLWGDNDHGRCYQFTGSTFNTTASSMTAVVLPLSGGISISANGTTNGIMWAYGTLTGTGDNVAPGVLLAFDANNLATQLYSSNDNPSRDSMGNLAKYSYPVIANGLVYISDWGTSDTGMGGLCIYGPITSTEGPYGGTPAAIPGTVQAENYDTGGQGVAYNVTSINGTDNGYRSDGVDLEACSDTGGGVDVGWESPGQWFRYTGNVAAAGTYTVSFRVAAPNAVTDAFHLSNASGTNLSGNVNVPATGGYQTWATVTASVTLPAGQQVLTLNQDTGGGAWNINYMGFSSSGSTTLLPTQNATVRDGTYANTNYNGATTLRVKNDEPANTRHVYLTFDTSSMATVSSAVINLYVVNTGTTASRTITVYEQPTTSWLESTITWNNAPAAGTLIGTFNVSTTTGIYYNFDVTSYVQAQRAAGKKIVSFELINNVTDVNGLVDFASKEATAGQPGLTLKP